MKKDQREEFFRIGEFLGIPWFRLYLADSLSSRISRETPECNLSRWLFLHMAVQAGGGHLRTDLGRLQVEMKEWYLPGDYSEDMPDKVSEALPRILKICLENGLSGRLSSEDASAGDFEPPRPPLVLTREGRFIYFLRRRKEEDSLLSRLEARIGINQRTRFYQSDKQLPLVNSDSPDGMLLQKLLDGRQLLFLAGGPGTGKTTTVGKLLSRLSGDAPDIVLAAPTGRAAARMSDSLNIKGKTLHSLLGIYPGSPPRYNRDDQLIADLLVVDEASMVDLPMMNALLDALPEDTPLILVGDPDQLPSVEAGALLGDLLQGEARASSEGQPNPLNDMVVRLTTVYRSGKEILNAASAVRDGDIELLKAAFRNDGRGVAIRDPGDPDRMADLIALRYKDVVSESEEILPNFSAQAVLTPLRRGPWGVPAMNDRISRILGGTTSPFPGMPVMITGNDPQRNLWNGDRGLVRFRDGHPRIHIPGEGGTRDIPMAALPGWEPAWVQTIHKSQGSEFDSVIVLLPEGAERLLTREILYTAFTRARNSVDLYADMKTVEATLNRGVVRHSRIQKWAAGTGKETRIGQT